jgi:uncharacterized protein
MPRAGTETSADARSTGADLFTAAIVKLTARCNLNCSYCYMFNQHDKTYTRVPKRMSEETALLLLDRIAEYLDATERKRFTLVLHGGEPTLWPARFYATFFERIGALRGRGLDLRVSVQTNGVRIPDDVLELYGQAGVSLGISIDGPQEHNDAFRVTHGGRGSYRSIMRTVEDMQARGFGRLIGGFLTVANPSIPPSTMLDWASSLPVRKIDLLWPMEFNYDNPPWGDARGHRSYRRDPRYGEWFAEVFREWWRRDDPELFVRLFFETILVLLGSHRHTDMLVNDRLGMLAVNTDGAIEYHDYFRSYRDEGTRTPFRLQEHGLTEIAGDPLFAFCMELGRHLPSECAQCPVVRPCGGGFLPGRTMRAEALPDRRSVLCYDQFAYMRAVLELVGPYLVEAQACTSEFLERVRASELPPMIGSKAPGALIAV